MYRFVDCCIIKEGLEMAEKASPNNNPKPTHIQGSAEVDNSSVKQSIEITVKNKPSK